MAKSLKRTIYYYRTFTPESTEPFIRKLRKVCRLPENEREFEHLDVTVNLEIHDITIENETIVVGVVRLLRSDAPSIGEVGTNTSEPIPLSENQGVNEKTHFAYHPKADVLAVEYSHHGPKVGLLLKVVNGLYTSKFDDEAKDNSYIYLSAQNGWQRVADSFGLKTVMFEYANITPNTLPQGIPYRTAMNDLLSTGTPQTAQITLKPEKNSHDPIMSIKEFASKFKNPLNNGQFSKLKVKIAENETGSVEEIDLIKDRLVKDFSVVLLKEGTKEINSSFLLESMAQDLVDKGFSYNDR